MSTRDLPSLATLIRAARENKGLSQRALSERVGIPQSHISKIEGGRVDLQASSLIQIARALDLELALVPRSLLPAVEALSVVRTPQQPRGVSSLRRQLTSLRRLARTALRRHPNARALERLLQTLEESDWLLSVTEQEETQIVLKATMELQVPLRKLGKAPSQRQRIKPLLVEIERAEQTLRNTRNALVHGQRHGQVAPSPAYQLDEEEKLVEEPPHHG